MVPVDENGVLKLQELKKAIREDTILISVMHANNEVGSFQPIEEVAKIAKEHRILFHVDAVQTMGKLKIHPEEMGIDLLSFPGTNFMLQRNCSLYIRSGVRFGKVLTGGSQENKEDPEPAM
ncbi:Cysteine desulfurase [Fusobacterium necrophorum subsp. necrophorum]|nr:Cysteine desulfurase [Fusobacterium necrophorum subsp. necrophorum]